MDHLTPAQLQSIRDRLGALPSAQAEAIRRALDQGSYGLCARCGEELAFSVLDLRPDLGLCPDCAGDLKTHRAAQRLGVCGVKPTDP